MATQAERSDIKQLQKDVGTITTDVAVLKNDVHQTKSDVSDIKGGMKAIMDGYVPTAIYVKDEERRDMQMKDYDDRIDANLTAIQAIQKTLTDARPGIQFSNDIVKQILKFTAYAIVVVGLGWILLHQGVQP